MRKGYCGWSACVCVCVCASVCLSVCEQVFSRALSAVGTEHGGMDKHYGCSVQQETGASLAAERRFPAARHSTGVHSLEIAPASRRSRDRPEGVGTHHVHSKICIFMNSTQW